jgi:hypothetical protein
MSRIKSAFFGGCETEPSEEELEQKRRNQRNAVKGILGGDDDVRELFEYDEIEGFFVDVTMEQLSELSELECYVEELEHRRAYRIAKQHEGLDKHVKVVDSEDTFEVRLDYVGAVGDDVTNEIVEDFASRFHVHQLMLGVFDPMAEDHDEPKVYVRPM